MADSRAGSSRKIAHQLAVISRIPIFCSRKMPPRAIIIVVRRLIIVLQIGRHREAPCTIICRLNCPQYSCPRHNPYPAEGGLLVLPSGDAPAPPKVAVAPPVDTIAALAILVPPLLEPASFV